MWMNMEVDMTRFKWLLLTILLVFFTTGCNILPFLTSIPLHFPEAQETPIAEPSPTAFVPTATLVLIPTLAATEVAPESTVETSTTLSFQPESFSLQEGSPFYLPNFAQPEAGYGWLGVAGQVFDGEGNEVLDVIVMVGDEQNPDGEPMIGITGTALAYGLGGFEVQLADGAIESQNRFWIQVLSSEGIPLTIPVYFNTFEDCDRNLVLINFVEIGDR